MLPLLLLASNKCLHTEAKLVDIQVNHTGCGWEGTEVVEVLLAVDTSQGPLVEGTLKDTIHLRKAVGVDQVVRLLRHKT